MYIIDKLFTNHKPMDSTRLINHLIKEIIRKEHDFFIMVMSLEHNSTGRQTPPLLCLCLV